MWFVSNATTSMAPDAAEWVPSTDNLTRCTTAMFAFPLATNQDIAGGPFRANNNGSGAALSDRIVGALLSSAKARPSLRLAIFLNQPTEFPNWRRDTAVGY